MALIRSPSVQPLGQGRHGLWRRRLTALGGGEGFRQGTLPTGFDDLFADGTQGFTGAVEVGLGAVVFMIGQELRQITRTNQRVDRPLFAHQPIQILCRRGGDDAVVRGDLGIVPGP